jgi:hypothetical protein
MQDEIALDGAVHDRCVARVDVARQTLRKGLRLCLARSWFDPHFSIVLRRALAYTVE